MNRKKVFESKRFSQTHYLGYFDSSDGAMECHNNPIKSLLRGMLS